MKSQIEELEQFKQTEMDLIQQMYEKKISYLTSKIDMKTKELIEINTQINSYSTKCDNNFDGLDQELKNEMEFTVQMRIVLKEENQIEITKLQQEYQLTLQNQYKNVENIEQKCQEIRNIITETREKSKREISPRKMELLKNIYQLSRSLS